MDAEEPMKFTSFKFTPMMLSAGEGMNIADFFEGACPEVGDAVEMVCYERSPNSVSMKWRVVRDRGSELYVAREIPGESTAIEVGEQRDLD